MPDSIVSCFHQFTKNNFHYAFGQDPLYHAFTVLRVFTVSPKLNPAPPVIMAPCTLLEALFLSSSRKGEAASHGN